MSTVIFLAGFLCGALAVHASYRLASARRISRARGSAIGIARFRKRHLKVVA